MEGVTEVKRRAKTGYILMIVINLLVYIALVVISALNIELFTDGPEYKLDISPASWVHLIWALIYFSLGAIAIYALTLTCRYNKIAGGHLYYDPPYLPPSFFAILTISHAFNVFWIYSMDSGYLLSAFLALAALWFSLDLCLFFSARLMWKYEAEIPRKEMWLETIIVHNSLATYSTWTFITLVLNLGYLIDESEDISMTTTSWICLLIIFGAAMFHQLIDLVFTPVLLRYVFAPYAVTVWFMITVVAENHDVDKNHHIFGIAMLAFFVLQSCIKVGVTVYRARTKPTALEESE